MPEDQQELQRVDLREYLRVIIRGKYIIAITTILVVGGALFYSYLQDNVYAAEAQLLVVPRSASQVARELGGEDSQRNIANELIILQGEDLENRVVEQVGHRPNVNFINVKGSDVITITARGKIPERVASDANVFAETYIATRRESVVDDLNSQKAALERDIAARIGRRDFLAANLAPSTQIQQVDNEIFNLQQQLDTTNAALSSPNVAVGAAQIAQAQVPTEPVSPKPLKNAIAALGIGLVLGIALAFLRDYVDDTIKTKDDVERASGLTVVGMIPLLSDWKDRSAPRLVARDSPTGPTAEAYRTLRTSIQFLGLERTIRTLLVTSPAASEGKSTTAANLAITFAHAGQRVVLLSSDFRRPRVHSFFGLTNQTGFTSVLLGETPFSEALQTAPDEPYVTVLPSGPRPPNPSELLNSRRAAEAIAALAGRFDLVLIDSPPVLPVSDSLVIAGLADAILVVAKAGQTRKKALHRSIELLRQVEAPLVGAVLNGADGGNQYGYGSEYGEELRIPKARRPKKGTIPPPPPPAPPSNDPVATAAAATEYQAGNGDPKNGKRRLFSRSRQT
jgi:receptor protein-tyrosine kinase